MTLTLDKDGERLDSALSRLVPELTRSQAQRLIEQGAVTQAGRPVKKNEKLPAGTALELEIPEVHETPIAAQPIPLEVCYEDADVIVVNKPKGLVVHPAPGHADGSFTVPPTKKPAAREYVFEILDDDGTPSGEYVTYMVQNDYRVLTQCGEIATKTTFVMENYGEPYTHSIAGFQSAACRYDPAADRTYRYAVGLSQHADRLGMEYSVPGGITVIRECAGDGERVVYYGDYTCADGTFTAALTPYKDGVPSGEARHVSGRIYLYEGYYALVSEEEGLPRLFMPYPETERTSFPAEFGPDIDAADLALAEKHAKSGRGVVYTGYELTCVTEDPYQSGSVYESRLRLPQLAYDTPEAQAWNEKIRNLYFTKHGAYIREAEQTGRGNIAFWVDYELSRTEIIENRVVEHIYTIVVREKSNLLGTCATSDSISVTHFSANSGAFLTDEAFLAKTASVYGGSLAPTTLPPCWR